MLQIYDKATLKYIGVSYNEDKSEYRDYHAQYNQGAVWTTVDVVESTEETDSLITGKKITYKDVGIEELKTSKKDEINKACELEITSGFTSSALGEENFYQSEEVDQLNLIGVVSGGVDDYFKCALATTPTVFEYKLHTIAQLKQVLNDGKVKKLQLLQKAALLKEQIKNSTLENINNIKW